MSNLIDWYLATGNNDRGASLVLLGVAVALVVGFAVASWRHAKGAAMTARADWQEDLIRYESGVSERAGGVPE